MAAKLDEMIAQIVRAEFADADNLNVRVEEATDSDGDPILRVTIIFDTSADIDVKKAPGLVRHILPQLEKRHVTRFPMLRLMTKADAEKLKAEAA